MQTLESRASTLDLAQKLFWFIFTDLVFGETKNEFWKMKEILFGIQRLNFNQVFQSLCASDAGSEFDVLKLLTLCWKTQKIHGPCPCRRNSDVDWMAEIFYLLEFWTWQWKPIICWRSESVTWSHFPIVKSDKCISSQSTIRQSSLILQDFKILEGLDFQRKVNSRSIMVMKRSF